MRGWIILGSAILVSLLAGCEEVACSSESLQRSLSGAAPGSVVRVGECEIAGAFTVPAGVTLEGVGPASVLRSVEGGAPVLELEAAEDTRVASLTLRVDHGGIGLRAVDGASARLSGLEVRVTRGTGIGLRALDRVDLDDVWLEGPITRETAAFAPTDPAETGAFGLVARRIGDLEVAGTGLFLTGLRARGFAVAALSVEDSTVDWRDDDDVVDIEATRGVGAAFFGTVATLEGVEMGGLFAGLGLPGVALASGATSSGARLSAVDLSISDGAGYGIFADDSDVELTGANLEDLGLVGAHLQGGSLVATDLVAARNGGAGLVVIDARSVDVERAEVTDQREVLLASESAAAPFADGIQVRRRDGDPVDLRLVDIVLSGNPRAGLLLDAADSAPARLELVRVRVAAEGTAVGVAAQRTLVPAGWDADVTREGAAAINDPAFSGGLDVVGIVMPPASMARPPTL